MAAVISTVPSTRPEPVSWMASHVSAKKWNWSPSTLTVSPAKSSRKSRTRNGRRSAGPVSSAALVAGASGAPMAGERSLIPG